MVVICRVCRDVADIFDNYRMHLWEAIGLYACGDSKKAVNTIKSGLEKSEEILSRVVDKLKSPELRRKVREAFEATKKEADKILVMMSIGADPEDIYEVQLDRFEYNQFSRQHELFYECMLLECSRSGTSSDKPDRKELKEFMQRLKQDLEAKR